jgi:uncharacterized repeat protein (TIGR01451 family)
MRALRAFLPTAGLPRSNPAEDLAGRAGRHHRGHSVVPDRRRYVVAFLLAVAAPLSTTALAQEADLAITKSDGSSVYTPGGTATYQIVVSNAGPTDVQGAQVDDPLPAGIGVGEWTCVATGTAACGQVAGIGGISTTVDLPAGTQATFVHTMSVPGGFTGPLVNTAVVDAPADIIDATPGNNQATDTNQMAVPPTVQLAKTSLGGTGTFGYTMANLLDASDSITTVTAGAVSNSALVSTVVDPATAVTVAETAATGFVLAGATCIDANSGGTSNPASFGTLAGTVLTIEPANLLPGAQIVCTFTNQFQMDVSVTKAATPGDARPGDVVGFTLTLANGGPGDATDVVLTDGPGGGLDCASPSGTATCVPSGGASCPGTTVPVGDLLGDGVTIASLPAGSQVVVTLQCEVTATGQ